MNENPEDNLIKIKEGHLIFALNENKTASVVGCDSKSSDIIIPRSIKYKDQEYVVTKINKESFKRLHGLNSIQFPPDSEVQTIEANSFINCHPKKILLPPSITNLVDGWISNNSRLKEVQMMSNNQYYQNYNKDFIIGKSDPNSEEYDVLIFANRTIKECTIPPFIKQISPFCFAFSKIGKIFIPEQITRIGYGAFSDCDRLKTVEFHPNSQLQIIEKDLFCQSNIESVTFPAKVKQINEDAFTNCNYLKSVKFVNDSELELIEKNAFFNSPIRSILIPSTTKLSEGWCFYVYRLENVSLIPRDNPNLWMNEENVIFRKSDPKSDVFDVIQFCPRTSEKVTIPLFVKEIDSYSFAYSCIRSIVFPPKVTRIGNGAFQQCQYLHNVEFTADSELDIIEDSAFSESYINTITIPSSVSIIGEGWLYDTKYLKTVNVIQNANRKQNILFYNNKFILGKSDIKSDVFDILIYASKKVKRAKIPPSVKRIHEYAFNYSSAVSVVIPESVEDIGANAFFECPDLCRVDFAPNTKIKEIKDQTFFKTSINHFCLPSFITKIGRGAFGSCKKLSCIDVPSNSKLETIEKDIFLGSSVRSFWIPSHVSHIDPFAFQSYGLQIIQFEENSELDKIEINHFCLRDETAIMIPTNMVDRIEFK